MKALKNLILGFLLAYSLTGCRDVIVLDLSDVPPRLVIEGVITDEPGPYYVKLSHSVKYYDDNTFPSLSNAVVTISDDAGNMEVLSEESPGIYATSDLQGVRGRTYRLDVEVDGEKYSAESTLPEQQIPLDSIVVEFKEESFFEDEGYYFTIYFNDPENVKNYYRLLVSVNGENFIFNTDDEDESNWEEDDNLWLADDKFTDGNLQEIELPHNLNLGDSLDLKMLQVDRSSYDYFRTLKDVLDGQGVAPANPLSNFEDAALGYFGAFSVTKNSVVVK
ncbi:DUF4249 domain-containing protein [Membranihabitans marinus]|uniref:DUF4249 domain-containing protein n=1 Tax=Membranihabitans marinus TaxID=1227546 RepID=UPI001F158DC3|nr:DUF4249 domain-containing protein [Membranihabitans marinus]